MCLALLSTKSRSIGVTVNISSSKIKNKNCTVEQKCNLDRFEVVEYRRLDGLEQVANLSMSYWTIWYLFGIWIIVNTQVYYIFIR